jgi:hypothetical protein
MVSVPKIALGRRVENSFNPKSSAEPAVMYEYGKALK